MGNQIHLLFIDLTKAYDSVPISRSWNIINEMNRYQYIFRAIQNLYRHSKAKVKVGWLWDKGLLSARRSWAKGDRSSWESF